MPRGASSRSRLWPAGVVALGISVWAVWLGYSGSNTGDDPVLFAPALHALVSGHLSAFFAHLPNDGAGGSLLLRSPAAAIGSLTGASGRLSFRFSALEAELTLAVLGLAVIAADPGHWRLAPGVWLLLGMLLLAPDVLGVFPFGHPEEVTGASLCVGAVLLAGEGRPGAAGVALGLAMVNKPWGVIAVLPVLLILAHGRRCCMGVAGSLAGAWIVADYLGAPSHFTHNLAGLPAPPWPQDVWWPLSGVHLAAGGVPYRALPALIANDGRTLAALLAVLVAVPLWRASPLSTERGLAVLALAFLVRCALDPSDLSYYAVPWVVAMACWEYRRTRLPLRSAGLLLALWIGFHLTAAGGWSAWATFLLTAVAGAALLARAAFRTTRALPAPANQPALAIAG